MRTCTPDAPLQPVPSHPETPSFSQGQNSLLATWDLAQVGQQEAEPFSPGWLRNVGHRGCGLVRGGWAHSHDSSAPATRGGQAPFWEGPRPTKESFLEQFLHASIFLGEKSTDSASPRAAPCLWDRRVCHHVQEPSPRPRPPGPGTMAPVRAAADSSLLRAGP